MLHDAFDAAIFVVRLNCSVWHVGAVCRQGVESTSHSLEHILFSAGGKLAWLISAEAKEVDRHRQGQTKIADSSVRTSSSIVCLYCAKSKPNATAARRNKSPSRHPRSGSLHSSSHRTPFYLSGRSKIEASAFALT